VGVWLGLLWVLFYFFDHYIQSQLWFNSKINPWMSSMTSWCLPIQGAGVHVAECGGCALYRGLNSGLP
jgi:hypothetical protein